MTEIEFKITVEKDDFKIPLKDQDLLCLMNKYRKEINDYVVEQLEDKDGGPHLSDFSISALLCNMENIAGSFRLHFKIDRQFCCSDILSCQTDYMDFKFKKDTEIIYITGSYISWGIQ